jgi:dipeptide/tripeptide permease
MDLPDNSPRPRSTKLSAEAMIGLGMTIGMFGVLFLLLGWAQSMRAAKDSSMILLVIGAVLFVIGAIAALSGSKRRG